jgi:hypothetical protein
VEGVFVGTLSELGTLVTFARVGFVLISTPDGLGEIDGAMDGSVEGTKSE